MDWKANGNSSGTLYIVQAKKPSDPDFKDIFTGTRVKYEHTGQTVGKIITYRVIARRGDDGHSAPSNEATVYS